MQVLFLALLLVGFLPSLARAQVDQALIELAKKEGEVVFYSSSATVDVQYMIDGFKKKYPFIKATYYRSGDDSLLNRVRTEAKAGRFSWDVIDTTTYPGHWLAKDGFLTQYLVPERANVRKGHLDGQGLWTSAHSNIHVLIYNNRLVSKGEVPKTHEELLDPKWMGKMAMDTKAYEWMANLLYVMGEEKGKAYMKKLGEQNISFRTGRTLNTQLVAAGELPIGIALYLHRGMDMKAKGAPIDWVLLEPAVANLHPTGLSAKAAHPNAGKLLIRHILAKETQQYFANSGRLPARKDVSLPSEDLLQGVEPYPSQIQLAERFNDYVKLYHKLLQVP